MIADPRVAATVRTAVRLPRYERGVVLLFALIALIAMSLAGIAFMRSVDTAGVMTGNLAFNRASVTISDVGIEAARNLAMSLDTATPTCANTKTCVSWTSNPAAFPCQAPSGAMTSRWYWANWQTFNDNFRDYDWANSCVIPVGTLPAELSGYQVSYVVHRMCQNDGDPVGNNCVSGLVTLTGGSAKGSVDYQSYNVQTDAASAQPFYRITVRVLGPRNSEAYVVSWML